MINELRTQKECGKIKFMYNAKMLIYIYETCPVNEKLEINKILGPIFNLLGLVKNDSTQYLRFYSETGSNIHGG